MVSHFVPRKFLSIFYASWNKMLWIIYLLNLKKWIFVGSMIKTLHVVPRSWAWSQRMSEPKQKTTIRLKRLIYLQLHQQRAFLSRKSHRATCIPRRRASNKISSNQTFNQGKKDFFCNNFASITASEETLPMIKNVSREDPGNCFRNI